MFDLFRASSCCWIYTRNAVSSWTLMTYIDLGVRSDTNAPNKSPKIAILPFIRYISADVVKLVQPVKAAWLENDPDVNSTKRWKTNHIYPNQHDTNKIPRTEIVILCIVHREA